MERDTELTLYTLAAIAIVALLICQRLAHALAWTLRELETTEDLLVTLARSKTIIIHKRTDHEND